MLNITQELYHYLECVHRVWTNILGDEVEPQNLDVETVRLFQSLMPSNSSEDVTQIRIAMRDFTAFPRVRNPAVRSGLETRTIHCGRVLTLKLFCIDTMHLQMSYKALADLFSTRGTTLRKACEASFKNESKYFRANYVDLWLHAMRGYFPKEQLDYNAEPRVGSDVKLSRLASLAFSCGFRTDQIDKQLVQCPAKVEPEYDSAESPELSCNHGGLPSSERCSQSWQSRFADDRKLLYSENIFHTAKKSAKKYATSFAVLRDIVLCFLGESPPIVAASEHLEIPSSFHRQNTIARIVQHPLRSPQGPNLLETRTRL